MISPRPRSFSRHIPLLVVLALAACGGGNAGNGSSGVVTVSGEGRPESPPPAAPAPPPPAPAPTSTTSVAAPTLAGLASVSSGINVADYLVKSWGTGDIPELEPAGPAGIQTEGAFRFLCAPSHNAYDDPIAFPGQPGKSHLHTFFGNTKANASSTYQSLRTTGESTCNDLLNRSAYWVPAMMNGRGKVVMPDVVSIYYKRPSNTDPYCTFAGKACVPLPRGLRYIFGYNMSNPAKSSPAGNVWFNCDGAGAVPGKYDNIAQAAKNCPAGARLMAAVVAPNCWNGTELDSADHRSHMAYMYYDGTSARPRCPATHPYIIPMFELIAFYTTDETLDRSGDESANAKTWYFASDRMAGMANMVPGSTFHADWFGAWEDSIQDLWTNNCINKMLSCNGGDLGNGQQMEQRMGYTDPHGTTLVDLPAN